MKIFESFKDKQINEGLISKQVPYTLNELNLGTLIIANEKITSKDVDFSRAGDSIVGKIKNLNTNNWDKDHTEVDYPRYFFEFSKGQEIGIVNNTGRIVLFWKINNHLLELDLNNTYHVIQKGLNILKEDGKLKFEKLNAKQTNDIIEKYKAKLK